MKIVLTKIEIKDLVQKYIFATVMITIINAVVVMMFINMNLPIASYAVVVTVQVMIMSICLARIKQLYRSG